jgi:hypothetical protein
LRLRRVLVALVILATIGTACGDDAADDTERFCELHAAIGAVEKDVAPADAPAVFGELRELLDELEAVAPDEIRDSVLASGSAVRAYLDLIESVGLDTEQLDQAQLDAVFSEEAIAHSNAMEEWVDVNCGA